MNRKQIFITLIVIALSIAAVCVFLSRQARTTSLGKSQLGPVPLNPGATENPQPSGDDWENDRPKKLPINDVFEFPFLGKVPSHSRIESVNYLSAGGVQTPFPLKVYYTSTGIFARAEYFRPEAEDQELPLVTAEKEYRNAKENIVSVPDKAAPANLQKLLNSLHGEYGGQFEKATKFNITYVLWEQYDQPPKPVFIINMFGTGKSFPKFPDDPAFLRIRYIFDVEGNMMFFDTVI